MKYLFTLVIMVLISQALPAQGDYRIIGSTHQVRESINAGFFLQSFEDRRPFRSNLGIVNRGANKDVKRQLIPESGFFESMLQQMNSWLLPEEGAKPVVAAVRELYLWENQMAKGGEGFIRLEMAFAGTPGEEETIIAVELSGTELKVADGHAIRLEAAFFQCLQKYSQQRRLGENAGAMASAGKGMRRKGPGVLAARNFLALWKEDFFPLPANLSLKGGPYRYQFARAGKAPEQPFYALKDGENLYIWAANYPGAGEYYTRVLEQGRYLFLIDDISFREESKTGRESGLASSGKAGIVIDMKTGFPQVVDDALMERLMNPYPELQEQYLFKDILKYPFQLTRVQNVIAAINRREQEN